MYTKYLRAVFAKQSPQGVNPVCSGFQISRGLPFVEGGVSVRLCFLSFTLQATMFIICSLQVKKLRVREVKQYIQDHNTNNAGGGGGRRRLGFTLRSLCLQRPHFLL